MLAHLTHERPHSLHAIPPSQPEEAAERTTRHLRMCAELANLAMQLAGAAAARTLADWAEPPAAEPSKTPAAEPQQQPAAEPQSHPETAPHANTPAARTASYKQTDPAVLFTRLAAVVRDCIALEARLTAATGPAPRARTLQRRADPRRAPLCDAFRCATENHPDRADLLRETTARLDEELAADAGHTLGPGDIFATICDELGIEINLATFPDEYLNWYAETTDPDEYRPHAPEPRATSPP